jgi:A/G-specific adenine glycosylase
MTGRIPPTRDLFVSRLFGWHATARRDLLIREASTPWEILVAEVMSQQTGIERVGPAWRRFVTQWPTPRAMAGAPTPELLAAWSGLGYNRRALALRDAARVITAQHEGRVPATVEALDALPGVGPYTARAVAASAFGEPVAPLDVNVRRVVSRVTGAAGNLQEAADALVPPGEPRRWLDAVMDLATLVCMPLPRCADCPLAEVCVSAGAVESPTPRAPSVRFPATRRWLRGRLVQLLTAAGGNWVILPDELGSHGPDAIRQAVAALAREGFAEVAAGRARICA